MKNKIHLYFSMQSSSTKDDCLSDIISEQFAIALKNMDSRIEYALRHLIVKPIKGVITKGKIKWRGIKLSIYRHQDFDMMSYSETWFLTQRGVNIPLNWDESTEAKYRFWCTQKELEQNLEKAIVADAKAVCEFAKRIKLDKDGMALIKPESRKVSFKEFVTVVGKDEHPNGETYYGEVLASVVVEDGNDPCLLVCIAGDNGRVIEYVVKEKDVTWL